MKNLILSLLLLAGVSTAQIKQDVNGGIFWSDSLWNSIYVDTSATPDDTTAAQTTSMLKTNFQYEWLTITCVDTGASYDDSIKVYGGFSQWIPDTNRIGDINMVSDTIWHILPFLRDSSWTNINLLVDDNAVKTYTGSISNTEFIKVELANSEAVENRIFKFYAILSRKR